MHMHLVLMLLAALWSGWHTSAITHDHGTPVFTVDGKPFFVYGAAFFYERTPRSEWPSDLRAYKELGINTIDLYLIWNWHEPDANTVDFDGHTNDRRDLGALFKLIHDQGFKVIVRPGPVIRNEWRNGGYPDWLLQRPDYNMPLHDILEGRYPATATLQNAHADAAGDEWLNNPTHISYAKAWLHDVLRAIEPYSDDVIAIALDDDQGAYIDNDTWPAPRWHAYMDWLKSTVQETVGEKVPLFINTFQMKVTASAPVWAWGNWYQSDAYRIGDHDLSQLTFSTSLLQTQPGMPVMASEFQAGWLQGAAETKPRGAAPEDTTLALHQMLQLGVHGVVNFPVQDTINPAGWEAPWANHAYAWDAALTADSTRSARYESTAAFGDLIRQQGKYLATLTPKVDATIAWLGSAYDSPQLTNAQFGVLAAATIAELQRCRALALTCRLVDLHYADPNSITTQVVIVPDVISGILFEHVTGECLTRLRHTHTVTNHIDAARSHLHSSTGGIADAALLLAPDGKSGILDVFNAATTVRHIDATSVALRNERVRIKAMTLAPGAALDIPLNAPTTPTPRPSDLLGGGGNLNNAYGGMVDNSLFAKETDVYHDGAHTFVLNNQYMRVVISADAGARVFSEPFTAIGGLRDDVQTPSLPSARDYIAPYTHPMPAGTFNRPYSCKVTKNEEAASVTCTYTAPDLADKPVTFEKQFVLERDATSFSVRLKASADAVSISSLTGMPDLFVVKYSSKETKWITFPLQGPPTVSTNPGGSP
jgi:hypothetical protein